MQLTNISNIIIPENRIRKEFTLNAINTLATSIYEKGLFHPPVVRKKDGKIILVAGERRIRAIKSIYENDNEIYFNNERITMGEIPITFIEDLSENEIKEAELDENLKRENLTWQEEMDGIAALHSIRKDEAEEEGRKYYYVDTARELIKEFGLDLAETGGITRVKNAIVISENLNEEVLKAKDFKEALKLIDRKKLREKREILAEEFKEIDSIHTLIHGDLFKEFNKLNDNLFDVIIADPPYGMDANKFSNQGAEKHSYKDSYEYFETILQRICNDGFMVTKEKAHIYIFCDINRFSFVKNILQAAGWDVFKTPLIWNKGPAAGLLPRPAHGPRRTYEAIAFGIKGNKETTGVFPDIISINAEQNIDIQRGARKPYLLYKNLLNRSTLPGDKVLDPCCGTGPIFTAATELNLIATGIEIDPEAIGYCREKLKEKE